MYSLTAGARRWSAVVQNVGDVCRRRAVSGQPRHRRDHLVSAGRPLATSDTGHRPLMTTTDVSGQSVRRRRRL